MAYETFSYAKLTSSRQTWEYQSFYLTFVKKENEHIPSKRWAIPLDQQQKRKGTTYHAFLLPSCKHCCTQPIPYNLSHHFFPALVLPVLLVPTGWDVDGWEAVMHEAESHRPGFWPEQLPPDQQIYNCLRRDSEERYKKKKRKAPPKYLSMADWQ